MKICVEKVAGEQGLALQQLFPQMHSKFFKSFNWCTKNFAILVFFDMLFAFLAFFKL